MNQKRLLVSTDQVQNIYTLKHKCRKLTSYTYSKFLNWFICLVKFHSKYLNFNIDNILQLVTVVVKYILSVLKLRYVHLHSRWICIPLDNVECSNMILNLKCRLSWVHFRYTCPLWYTSKPILNIQAIDDPSSNQFRDPPTYTHQPSMQQKVPFSLIRCSSSKVAFCSCVCGVRLAHI